MLQKVDMFPARNIPSKQRYVHMLYIFNSGYALHAHLRVAFRTFMGGLWDTLRKNPRALKPMKSKSKEGE